METNSDNETMHVRRITLADGRYLLFYTFDHQTEDANQLKADSRGESDATDAGGEQASV